VLVPHILSAVAEALHELEAVARSGPVNMLTMLQHLALEIAGRTMFSSQMGTSGPRLREFIAQYGQRLGRPYLLDMLMPANWPTPHDLARSWFRRAWLSYIEEIITQRQRMNDANRPRDLLDLLTAARDPETGKGFSPAQLRDQVTTMILAGTRPQQWRYSGPCIFWRSRLTFRSGLQTRSRQAGIQKPWTSLPWH
jgi:cytochrome P450